MIDKIEKQNIRFIITVPFYNVEKYIKKCIESIKLQTYSNFVCVVTDDHSSDNSYKMAVEAISGDNRFKLITNKSRKDVMENTVNAIKIANPNDEDVIVNIDGDDWLAHEGVLEKVANKYEEKDILLTYGTYKFFPSGEKGHTTAFPKEIIKKNLYRRYRWNSSHLRTFKFKLWKNIKEDDLKHPDGSWMFPAADVCFMLPMLEMSGGKFHFFDEILYVYNRETPLNADKDRLAKQKANEAITRSRKSYDKLY